MANEYSLIFFRKGTGVWWDNTDKPSGATGFTHGKMTYGTSGTPNYLVSGGVNTFNQGDLSSGKAEPWVNTSTNQLFVGNVCINPEVKVKLHGTIVNPTLTFDENYKVQSIIDISEQDQYLETVSNLAIPTTSAGANDIKIWMVSLLGGQASDYTATLNDGTWTVTWGSPTNTQTFTAGSNEICFVWNLSDGVQTPTFMEIPDTNTDTTYDLIVGGTVSATSNTTTALTNGNVYLNLAGSDSTVDSHLINGIQGISVTAQANNGTIEIGHSNTITSGTLDMSLTGNVLNYKTVNYDANGHISSVSDSTLTLPTGGGSGSGSYNFAAGEYVQDVTPTAQSTPNFIQGAITETHEENDGGHTGYVSTSTTTVEIPTGVTVNANDRLSVANVGTFTVQSVSGNEATLSTALPSANSITGGMTVVRVYTTAEAAIVRMQQHGITSTNISSYDGTKVTFKEAGNNNETATGTEFAKTLLISIEVIDGGVFD